MGYAESELGRNFCVDDAMCLNFMGRLAIGTFMDMFFFFCFRDIEEVCLIMCSPHDREVIHWEPSLLL